MNLFDNNYRVLKHKHDILLSIYTTVITFEFVFVSIVFILLNFHLHFIAI